MKKYYLSLTKPGDRRRNDPWVQRAYFKHDNLANPCKNRQF